MQIKGGSFNPTKNIMSGTHILRHNFDKTGDLLKAIGSYQRGISGYRKYFKKHKHHSKYVLKVMKVYNQYLEIEMRKEVSKMILQRFK